MIGLLIALVSITGLQFLFIIALFSDINEIKYIIKKATNIYDPIIVDFRRDKK
jgi:hypothetical protein